MEFLEREAEMQALTEALAKVERGSGRVVLISGEAGIGKTRLVEEFLTWTDGRTRTVWGACDDLVTPRALGPFRDIARGLGIEDAVGEGGATAAMYGILLEALDEGPRPTVAVVEDAHWADAASLDVLKYVGRRVERTRVLLMITFRDDEVTAEHPLRPALGQIPADVITRLALRPLSAAAVARLTGDRGPAGKVYELTRGNPFLVSEVLATGGEGVPGNVLDSLTARLGHLDREVREVVELVAVVPGRCERSVVEAHHPGSTATLEAAAERGFLDHDDGHVWFRHELARRAVEEAIRPARRSELHRSVAGVLAAQGADPARIVHHADQGGDVEALVDAAPRAAHHASSVAAHGEARSHLRRVLPHLGRLPEAVRAGILAEYAVESHLVDEQTEALDAAGRALEIYRRLGDDLRVGEQLRFLSRVRWWLGDRPGAYQAAREAIQTLEGLGESPELAMAYSSLAQLHMLAHETGPAIEWASRAIDAARRVGASEALSHALNNLGSARCRAGDLEGRLLLTESYDIARREGLDDHASRAISNHIWILLENRLYDDAAALLAEGVAFAEDRELEGNLNYLVSERAWLRFDRGEWAAAEGDARWVLGRPQAPGITTLPALITLARIQVRRGDPEADATLADAWRLAGRTGELQRMAPAASALAERAWLAGNVEEMRAALRPALDRLDDDAPLHAGDELLFWAARAGLPASGPAGAGAPYAAHLRGDWSSAAAEWHRLGCPYEEALALAESEEKEPLMRSLAILDGLGAVPAAALVRRSLRDRGVVGVPRGPRPATRSNPAGLTPRQYEVLELVAVGLTNAEIAERLFISAKTVDHHVSAILAKFGAATRGEAAERASGWL